MAMVYPSLDTLACLLHLVRKQRKLAHATHLHIYIQSCGQLANGFLGDLLVSMLVEVGCIDYAQQVFDGLPCRNEYSWNALIIGYAKHGDLERAFLLHQEMQLLAVPTTGHAFVALLKACIIVKDVKTGSQVHSAIAKEGLESDLYIGSTLIDMYGKFHLLAKAQDVFDKLVVRDAVCWSSLIAAYVQHGQDELGLLHFRKMQFEDMVPTTATLICTLKACGAIRDADLGGEIHTEIVRSGLIERDPGIGNIVVDMYAKCALLGQAQEVFDTLPVQDVVSWTTLITGYVKCGYCEQALECFQEMQAGGVSPDTVTYVSSLDACSSLGYADMGQEIHAEVVRRGLYEGNNVVEHALVCMYANCTLLVKAEELLERLVFQDVVPWTAIVTGYVQCGKGKEALDIFDKMQQRGIAPNSVTLICGLQACGLIAAADKGRELHAEIARKGLLDMDIPVENAVIDMYCKCGLLVKAHELFLKLACQDVVSWNIMISGYVKHEWHEEALSCFEQMKGENGCPDPVTYTYSLKACGALGNAEEGQALHTEIAAVGLLEGDLDVGNTLVDMYAMCGLFSEAVEVFFKLPVRDAVAWTALIAGCVRHGHYEVAIDWFDQMQHEGTCPNAVTFSCIVKTCCHLGATEKGQEIHADIARRNLLQTDLVIENALIDMYSRCGLLTRAQDVFEELPVPDQLAWNALVAGYAQTGETERVFEIVDRMSLRQEPNMVTFVSVLSSCSHVGAVTEGLLYLEVMKDEYDLIPHIEHLTCTVDLYGRAGQLNEAFGILMNMPCHPNLVSWHTLLGSCRRRGDTNLGLQGFVHANELDQKGLGSCLSILNIYADAEMECKIKVPL